eukprot:2169247-Amphidinium_carterae.1
MNGQSVLQEASTESQRQMKLRQSVNVVVQTKASSPVVSEDEAGSRSTSAPRQPREELLYPPDAIRG